jgi:tRNA A58 N-methylase Trm61
MTREAKQERDLHPRCHRALREVIQPGDAVIDATAGNGHDTCCLAEAVGSKGQVYAFDIQRAALDAARERLRDQGLDERVTWNLAGHEFMSTHLPGHLRGKIRAITFNLGYLPGGDHSLTTRVPTTLAALEEAIRLLAPGGLITLMIYHGHPEGVEEKKSRPRLDRKAGPRAMELLGCLGG